MGSGCVVVTSDREVRRAAETAGAAAIYSGEFGARLQTSLTGTARKHLDQWAMSGTGMARWHFNPSNSLAVSASTNELWRDPFVAAFQDGR